MNDNLDYIRKYFGPFPRFTSFLCTGKDKSVNLASKEYFIDCLRILEEGYDVEIKSEPKNLTFSSTCFKMRDSNGNKLCVTTSPYDLFYDTNYIIRNDDSSLNYFRTVRNKPLNITTEEFLNKLRNGPYISVSESKLQIDNVLSTSNNSETFIISALIHQQFARSTIEVRNGAEFDKENDLLEEIWARSILSTEHDLKSNHLEWFVQSTFE